MKNIANTDPSFNSASESAMHYDEFYGPMYFEPYAIEVANRIDPSKVSVALEIAAGTGRVTRHLRKRIPASAKLIASDIDEDMLRIAKNKLSGPGIEWQKIDAQQLPFSDNSIDLVVCCFGYMFVPDKSKAFAEAYRVLRTGGMLLFMTWDSLESNAASYTYLSEAKKYLDAPLPDSIHVATSMSDEAGIRSLVEDAGFSRISIEKVQKESVCSTAREAAVGFSHSGAVVDEIRKQEPALIDQLIVSLEKELSQKFGSSPMVAPISAVICQAWK